MVEFFFAKKKRIYIILWNSLKSREIKLTYLRRLSPKGGWITTVATTNSARTEGERCAEDASGARRRAETVQTTRRRRANSATTCGRPAEGERTPSGLWTDGERGLRTDGEREKDARLFRKKLCMEKMETGKRKRKEGRKKLGIWRYYDRYL